MSARGPDFSWSFVDRFLIAGHAICFYAMKLFWPHPLIFMYPRWNLHESRALQFVYPVLVGGIVMMLFFVRDRIGRGPIVAVLFFIGTLTPALGFVNVYPMRYSFVADHFQYLASIGLIALAGSALSQLRYAARALPMLLLVPLIGLNITQQLIYKDAQTLWENTIAQNETCWMAHVNLAGVYGREKKLDAAIDQSRRALQLAPNEADTQYDMGVALALRSDWTKATDRFRKAVACDNQCAEAWSYLSLVLWQHMDSADAKAEAVTDANLALSIRPGLSAPHFVLGSFAELRNDIPTAIAEYRAALTVDPDDIPVHANLGRCLLETGHPEWAAGEFLKVLEHHPGDLGAMTNLGNASLMAGRNREAIEHFKHALSLDPNWAPAREGLARAMK